jgi:hypothetical protein
MTIEQIIEALNTNNIDGETMEYIIEQVCMKDQMLRQLVLTAEQEELTALLEERQELNSQVYI